MIKKIMLLMLLATCANAYTISYLMKDINTKVPIQGVKIELVNNTGIETVYNFTNTNGLVQFDAEGSKNYSYTMIGYFSNTGTQTFTTDTNIIYYMTPISENGIVRINFFEWDALSMSDRSYCIYYKENNRLDGCYHTNDTIQLIVNKEYIIKPQIKSTDMLSSAKNMKTMSGYYIGYFWPMLILILFIAGLMYVLKFKK